MIIPEIHLVKRGNRYQADFTFEGKRYRKATKAKDEKTAMLVANRFIESLILESKGVQDYPNMPLNLLLNLYIERHENKRSKSHFENFKRFKVRILEFLGESITPIQLDKYRLEDFTEWLLKQPVQVRGRKNNLSPKTVSEHLNFLASVFNYFEINPNPCRKVERPKKSQSELMEVQKFYSKDEINKIMGVYREKETRNYDDNLFLAWFNLFCGTGARSGELQNLRFKDLNLDSSKIRLTSDKTKTTRVLTLNNHSGAIGRNNSFLKLLILAAYRFYLNKGIIKNNCFENLDLNLFFLGEDNEDQLKEYKTFCQEYGDLKLWYQYDNLFYKRLKISCRKARVDFKGVHALRHSFASFALSSGNWSIEQLAKWLGHKNINLTYSLYSHFTVDSAPDYDFLE